MAKKKNWLEKFQDFWGKLDGEERGMLYDVMAAIRGPDIDYSYRRKQVSSEVKIITARIRYELYGSAYSVAGWHAPSKSGWSGEFDMAKKILKKHPGHYFNHSHCALIALQRANPGCLDDIKEIFEGGTKNDGK